MRARQIRTIADFMDLPERDLAACLTAFREWVAQQKALKATVEANGENYRAPDAFSWSKRESKKKALGPLNAHTPVEDLGLKPSALRLCKELRILVLEDFSAVEEEELLRERNIGRHTLVQISEQLRQVGLAFRPPQNEDQRVWRRAAQLRAGHKPDKVDDEDHIVELGLNATSRTRLVRQGINTVGQLRHVPLRDLSLIFGKASWQHLLTQLQANDLALQPPPSQLAQWRAGLLSLAQLRRPEDNEDVEQLQPWLGSVAALARGQGITTVGQLKALALQNASAPPLVGVGAKRWRRAVEYFGGAPRASEARKDTGDRQLDSVWRQPMTRDPAARLAP